MKSTTDQPANMDEMFERTLDSIAKTRRDAWFGMCTTALFIATIWKGEAVAQMTGVPHGIVMLVGFAPSFLNTIQSSRETKALKAKTKAEIARRELERESKPLPPVPPIASAQPEPQRASSYPTTGHVLKLLAWAMLGAIFSIELLLFIVLLVTMQKGEQLAHWSGAPVWAVYAVGFTPALLYTIKLLWSQRQRQIKRNDAKAPLNRA